MTTAGPNYASNIYTIESSSANWTNPTNAGADDGSYATCATTVNDFSDILTFQQLGFSIPTSATVNGIQITVEGKQSVAGTFADALVGIERIGGVTTSNLANWSTTTFGTTDTVVNYGGATELWGNTWAPSNINDSGTQAYFAIQKASGTTSRTFSVDYLRVTVYYTTSGGTTTHQSRVALLRAGR